MADTLEIDITNLLGELGVAERRTVLVGEQAERWQQMAEAAGENRLGAFIDFVRDGGLYYSRIKTSWYD